MRALLAPYDKTGLIDFAKGLVSLGWELIATGNTERQTKAIEESIYQDLKHGDGGPKRVPERVEGASEARWILMDYLDTVVHVFTPAARDYYRLETLWGEVPELEVEQTA